MTSERCSECGRKLTGLMAESHDVDPLAMIAGSPALIAAVCLLFVLAVVGFEAMLR